tara:strand:- start:371 stop:817 length:447 start_codon:yes stop_codon:yes gene_type:complete
MKKILFPLLVLILGAGVGAGSGYGAGLFLGPPEAAAEKAKEEEAVPTTFVAVPRMVAPLVLTDGHLSGYAAFEVQLEVTEADAGMVHQRVPLLQHAINLRTFRTPMAAGMDGSIPDLDRYRDVVAAASVEVLGKNIVRKVAITQAVPD